MFNIAHKTEIENKMLLREKKQVNKSIEYYELFGIPIRIWRLLNDTSEILGSQNKQKLMKLTLYS